jgi:hypothetical protein
MTTTIPAMVIATDMSRGAPATTIAVMDTSTIGLGTMTTITPAMATAFSTVTPTATTATGRTQASAACGGH